MCDLIISYRLKYKLNSRGLITAISLKNFSLFKESQKYSVWSEIYKAKNIINGKFNQKNKISLKDNLIQKQTVNKVVNPQINYLNQI